MGKPSRFQMSWRQKQRRPCSALVSMLDPGTVPKLSSHTEVLSMSCPWGVIHITVGRTEQVGLQRRQRCRISQWAADTPICQFACFHQPRPLQGNPIKSQVTQAFLSLVRLWCHSSTRSPHDESRRPAFRPAGAHCVGPPTPAPSPHPDLWVVASQPCLIFFFFIDMKTFSLKLPSLGLTKTL